MSTTVRTKTFVAVMCLAAIVALTPGCHKKAKPINPDLGAAKAETTSGTGQPTVNPEDLLFSEATGLQRVYFDYNSYALRPDALAVCNDNAEKIKQVPNVYILCEGHCDQRGSQEYNLALGDKRALAVRDQLIKLGVSGDRLLTVSYGKEKPAVDGNDEGAWKMNRRVQFSKGVKK